MRKRSLSRRRFLATAGGGGAALALGVAGGQPAGAEPLPQGGGTPTPALLEQLAVGVAQQFEALWPQLNIQVGHTRQICTRPAQTGDETGFDRIVAGYDDGLPAPDEWSPDGFTPLHIAAFVNNAAAARALLAEGADPDTISTASFAQVTPLGTCAFSNAIEVALVLLEYGADQTLGAVAPVVAARHNGYDELAEVLA